MCEANVTSESPGGPLAVGDAVRLREDPRRRGYVIRTYANAPGRMSHTNWLILRHTVVPEPVLKDFVYTNVPQEGYIFVSFNNVAQGYALIKESDLELIDRPLRKGLVVRRGNHNSIHGTVLETIRTLDLESIMVRVPGAPSDRPIFQDQGVASTSPTDMWRLQLHDIPADEVRGYEEFNRDDFVIIDEKLAVIEKISYDCWVQLTNETITKIPHDANIKACDIFAIPTALSDRALVANTIAKDHPKHYVQMQPGVWHLLIHPDSLDQLHPGQRVLGSPRVFRQLPFLQGRFREELIQPHGYFECNILGLVPVMYQVRWICANLFLVKVPRLDSLREQISADNVHLRARKVLSGSRYIDSASGSTVMAPANLCVGAHVMFENGRVAALKYPEMKVFPIIFGNDLNVYTVTGTKTQVQVLWEDGSQTSESSKDLWVGVAHHSHDDEEDILMPGTLVVPINAIAESTLALRDRMLRFCFNKEMANDRISCKRIGVVQRVKANTRTAFVKWFEEPHVELFQSGSILNIASTFGDVETEEQAVHVDDLEVYQALNRRVGDFIVFAPPRVSQEMIDNAYGMPNIPGVGFCHLVFLFPAKLSDITEYLSSVRALLVEQKWFLDSTMIGVVDPPGLSGVYFLAQITNCNLDGTLSIEPLGDYGIYGRSQYILKIDQERALLTIPRDTTPGLCFDDLDTPSASGDSNGDRGSNGVRSLTDVSGSSSDYRGDHVERDSGYFAAGIGYEADQSDSSDDDSTRPNRDEILHHIAETMIFPLGSDIENYHLVGQATTIEQQLNTVSATSQSQTAPDDHSNDEEQTEYTFFGLDGTDDAQSGKSPVTPDNSILDSGAESSAKEYAEPCSPYDPGTVPDYREYFKNAPSSCPDAFAILDGQPPEDYRFPAQSQTQLADLQRLHFEYSILRTSLPPNIFVRTWESHMNLLRVLIFGVEGTPYEFAAFIFDIHLVGNYPEGPPRVFYHNWEEPPYDINPNIDVMSGTVCLSLLGTWKGSSTELWSKDSTILQLLVSIQGLVLVKDPFFNEAGWEYAKPMGNEFELAKEYHENAYVACRSLMCHTRIKGTALEDILSWYYVPDPGADSANDDFPHNPTRRPNYLHKAVMSLGKVMDHHKNTRDITAEARTQYGPATEFMDAFSDVGIQKLMPRFMTLMHMEAKAERALYEVPGPPAEDDMEVD